MEGKVSNEEIFDVISDHAASPCTIQTNKRKSKNKIDNWHGQYSN